MDLTETEKAFIYKAYENKTVTWTTQLRNAVLNGVSNALRKKGNRIVPLWKKKPKKADMDLIEDNIKIANAIDKQNPHWIDEILDANGFKKRKKVKKNV